MAGCIFAEDFNRDPQWRRLRLSDLAVGRPLVVRLVENDACPGFVSREYYGSVIERDEMIVKIETVSTLVDGSETPNQMVRADHGNRLVLWLELKESGEVSFLGSELGQGWLGLPLSAYNPKLRHPDRPVGYVLHENARMKRQDFPVPVAA